MIRKEITMSELTEYTNDLAELDLVADPPTENTTLVAITIVINGKSKTFAAEASSVEVAGVHLAAGLLYSSKIQAQQWLDGCDDELVALVAPPHARG